MNEPGYLFVYGTLRQGFDHPMSMELQRRAGYIGPGYVYGRLFDLGSYPGAVLSQSVADKIVGDVYYIKANSSLLKMLDDYEGEEYERVRVKVQMRTTISEAWIYVFIKDTSVYTPVSSGDYLAYHKEKLG